MWIWNLEVGHQAVVQLDIQLHWTNEFQNPGTYPVHFAITSQLVPQTNYATFHRNICAQTAFSRPLHEVCCPDLSRIFHWIID